MSMLATKNLVEMLQVRIKEGGAREVLRYNDGKGFLPIRFRELGERSRDFGRALIRDRLPPRSRIAILSENRPEWVYADFGAMMAGGITVPLFPTASVDTIRHILADSETILAVVSTEKQLNKILEAGSHLSHLKKVVVIEEFPALLEGPHLVRFGDFVSPALDPALDAELDRRIAAIQPPDLVTLIYTSGTTGDPKGVMLNHANFLSNIRSSIQMLDIGERDRVLSILPLSHVFERGCGHFLILHQGGSIVYATSMHTLLDDLQTAAPTLVLCVPRFYEKVFQRIHQKIGELTGFQRAVAGWALKVGKARALTEEPSWLLILLGWIANLLVFRKLRKRLGGRLRFFVSGGAALPRYLGEFFRGIGVHILEGYGMTETSPVISVNSARKNRLGTVGKVVPGVEVRIAKDGEIQTRSGSVMPGYWGQPHDTRAVLAEDGWLSTGDIGKFDSDGFLAITDRKKDLLITSGGKNIAPQPIENRLLQHDAISQIVVCGDGQKSLSALIVPERIWVENLARTYQMAWSDYPPLLEHPVIQKAYSLYLRELNTGQADYEKVKKFHLIPDPFTVEDGTLTPTLKVRRKQVYAKYGEAIRAMYAREAGE